MSRGHQTFGSQQGVNVASAARNYRPCNLKVPRLLGPHEAFSPRCPDTGENRWPSARTSVSVGEEMFHYRQGKTDVFPPCRSQVNTPYYTKYLEGKMQSIQEEHQNIIAENETLNNQLSKIVSRNRELKEKVSLLEEALLKDKHQAEAIQPQYQQQSTMLEFGVNTILSGPPIEVSTLTDQPQRYECAVQTNLEQQSNDISSMDVVSITKSELESLENDMKTLRDAVKAKEEQWNQAVECERSYREHLARLSVELMTAQQETETRCDELQTYAQKLAEKDDKLYNAQKELNLAKKTIRNLKKLQSGMETDRNNQETTNQNDNTENRQQNYKQNNIIKFDCKPQSPLIKQKVKQKRDYHVGTTRTEELNNKIKDRTN